MLAVLWGFTAPLITVCLMAGIGLFFSSRENRRQALLASKIPAPVKLVAALQSDSGDERACCKPDADAGRSKAVAGAGERPAP